MWSLVVRKMLILERTGEKSTSSFIVEVPLMPASAASKKELTLQTLLGSSIPFSSASAVMCRACTRKDTPTPQLEFCQSLAMKMMTNKISNDGMVVCSPTRARKHSRGVESLGHELCTRPNFTGCWKTETNTWSKVKTEYAKIKCSTCNTKIRTYCKCNRQVSLCTQCYGVHISMVNNNTN